MALTVSIDELDILSVSEGQSAVITLDALEGETFEGKITSINTNGTSSGGVTKYEVEVTVDKNENMLSGMNASVSIVIQESDDTLYIPAAALQEKGSRTFVYTEYNESTEQFSGEVEIEIGNADGTKVEIISGLSEGDTIYYEIVSASDSGDAMYGFPSMDGIGGGGMPDMSDMPGGGDFGGGGMPSGGPGGGM